MKTKEVEAEKIDRILKAAMAAPSATNQRPWEFLWSKTKKHWQRYFDCSPYGGCIKDAAMAIVPVYRKEMMMPEFADIDMAACTQNILLEVTELGFGSSLDWDCAAGRSDGKCSKSVKCAGSAGALCYYSDWLPGRSGNTARPL